MTAIDRTSAQTGAPVASYDPAKATETPEFAELLRVL